MRRLLNSECLFVCCPSFVRDSHTLHTPFFFLVVMAGAGSEEWVPAEPEQLPDLPDYPEVEEDDQAPTPKYSWQDMQYKLSLLSHDNRFFHMWVRSAERVFQELNTRNHELYMKVAGVRSMLLAKYTALDSKQADLDDQIQKLNAKLQELSNKVSNLRLSTRIDELEHAHRNLNGRVYRFNPPQAEIRINDTHRRLQHLETWHNANQAWLMAMRPASTA